MTRPDPSRGKWLCVLFLIPWFLINGCGSVSISSRPVGLDTFAEYFRIMSANSNEGFSRDFKDLEPVGRDQPHKAAELACNKMKNRYPSILPYDRSRVLLRPKTIDDENDDCSNYINANYLPGHNSANEYIGTQGPYKWTAADFWSMVWDSNSRAIVMLTLCEERGKEKSYRYWPTQLGAAEIYGDVSVTMVDETQSPDWNTSTLLLRKDGIERLLPHFHFTSWPDFSVPTPPQILTDFIREFRERVEARPSDDDPVVVHCSAGVGRSGTFVALDRLLQEMDGNDRRYVDVFGTVWSMRERRPEMVEIEQQYAFLHRCILDYLKDNEAIRVYKS